MERLAAEVIERKDDFEDPFLGGADQIIDKYHNLLGSLCRVRAGLYNHLPRDEARPAAKDGRSLGKDEFRCFRCRSIISADADACPGCGWTWG